MVSVLQGAAARSKLSMAILPLLVVLLVVSCTSTY